jgi:hypothetical protein
LNEALRPEECGAVIKSALGHVSSSASRRLGHLCSNHMEWFLLRNGWYLLTDMIRDAKQTVLLICSIDFQENENILKDTSMRHYKTQYKTKYMQMLTEFMS